MLKIVCGGSREICEIMKEEEEEENSDVNDGSMRSNNRNIHTEVFGYGVRARTGGIRLWLVSQSRNSSRTLECQ